MIEVLRPGLHTLVQDRGRAGHYAIGLPPSGALDMYSHDVANLLVGNAVNAATLEATLRGPTLTFQVDTTVAVTGAAQAPTLDGEPIECWATVPVRRGQTLAVPAFHEGVRAYVAVRGGIDTPPVMGSRSTYVACGLGGVDGRALRSGDLLPIGDDTALHAPKPGMRVPVALRSQYATEREIRVVPGLCDYRLTGQSFERLYGSVFEVSPEANRIGYRYRGAKLDFVEREQPFGAGSNPSNVVDLGYPIGSIQVPNGDEPICLLRDAVTGGGYATVGTVISADLDLVAQSKAPDRAVFTPVTVDAAIAARRDRRNRLAGLADLVRGS